jgi:DNA-binding MarR family transcriptional regulator
MSNGRRPQARITSKQPARAPRFACLCLNVQRAARSLARHFDEAFRPLGITSGQFSLMMLLNQPEPPTIGSVSELLAMDRTTLTANVKPLARRGLVTIEVDRSDRRSRRLRITELGRRLLVDALPIWKREHKAIERRLDTDVDRLRADLTALA